MNIFEIRKEYLEILDILEENGGEETDEVKKLLFVNREEVVDKLCQYRYLIEKLKPEIEAGKKEIERINKVINNKKVSIQRLEEYSKMAIEMYGLNDLKSTAKNIPKYVSLPQDVKAKISYTESIDVRIPDITNLKTLPKELENFASIDLSLNGMLLLEFNQIKQGLIDLLEYTVYKKSLEIKVDKKLLKEHIDNGEVFENANKVIKATVTFK